MDDLLGHFISYTYARGMLCTKLSWPPIGANHTLPFTRNLFIKKLVNKDNITLDDDLSY